MALRTRSSNSRGRGPAAQPARRWHALNHGSAGAILPAQVDMKKREFHVIIEQDTEGYYVATVPELAGCHTQAKSLDTLMKRVREAIQLCLEVEKETPTHFVGLQTIVV